MDDGAIVDLKTNECQVSCEKLRKTQIPSVPEGGHTRDWGRAGESLEAEYGFHLHLECEGKTEIEKMTAWDNNNFLFFFFLPDAVDGMSKFKN